MVVKHISAKPQMHLNWMILYVAALSLEVTVLKLWLGLGS